MTEPQIQSGKSIHRVLIFFCCTGALVLLACVLGGGWMLIVGFDALASVPPEATRSPPAAVGAVPVPESTGGQTGDERSDSPESAPAQSGFMSAQIAERVSSRQRQTASQNLSELDAMTRRLDSMSSDKSVDALADHFQTLMGLESRVAQPTTAAAVSEFDIDSAQLHDVKRTEKRTGDFKYTAVLIDAKGQTLDVELTAAEGLEVYSLMQRIKASPLLERVYRRIAMPFLDSIVQSAKNKAAKQ